LNTYLKLTAASLALGISASAAAADCGEVTITEMNWSSAAMVTAVSKFFLEQGYGCEVTALPSSTVPAVTSVAETGQPDILTEIWLQATPAYSDLEKEGKIITVANVLEDGGEEGWWVPKYLVDEHPELAKLEGVLANPELVGARFNNCPEGWGCRIRWDNLLPVYGVEEAGIEIFNHGSGETLAASLASAYESKEPWFGYYWGPTSILGKYPMVKVDRGPYNEEAFTCATTEDCANPQPTGDAPAPVVTGITPSLQEREPEVAEFMSNVVFPNQVMSQLLAWQEENNASSEETAVFFLTNHQDIWADWLNDEAKSKLAALIK